MIGLKANLKLLTIMCGISGFIDFKKNTTQTVLEKMNRTMTHRGPDGEGYAYYNTDNADVGLGHRRLSIIDLSSAGTQPFNYQHLHLTYNGEIYNFSEIKLALEQKGHQFKSHSDTEVIVHAYAEWGTDCIQKFIGMFAFVIYDENKNEIFGCRDRAGVKPFFYYQKNDLFLFSSELKAIVAHPAFEKNIDLDAVGAYMQYGYVPTPHCIFEDTYKLKPGHYFTYNITQKEFNIHQYWNVYDAYNKAELKIDLPEAIAETEKLLLNAFQYRMVSDVPVGVFLSGGYDSACVTALLQKSNTEKIKTFTIGMPDAGLDEAPFAKQIAKHLGTDHTEFYCTEKEALDIIPELPYYYDEPFADSSAIPTTLVSRIAKEKVTVALSADGGDEIFAGYNHYQSLQKNNDRLNRIPFKARKPMASIMNAIKPSNIPVIGKNKNFVSKYLKLAELLKNPSYGNLVLSNTKLFTDAEIKQSFIAAINSNIPTAFKSKELKENRFSLLHYNMAIDYQTYLPDDILQKVDRAGMSVSLEGREPFLDHRVIEWAAQLPQNFKIKNAEKKYIIKEIVHKYLPKQMMDRPKMGFGIPINKWLKEDLKMFVDEYLSDDFIEKQNIFQLKEIKNIKDTFYKQNHTASDKIWYLLMFQMWYKQWI